MTSSNAIAVWWCRTMHSKAMWPIHGRYICPDCGRVIPVSWEAGPPRTEPALPRPTAKRRTFAPDSVRLFQWLPRVVAHYLSGGLKRSDTM